ncbi:rab-GTPase-TBC domain-containing protein [Pyronema omphalodes]|nr:rab-GTPase-TBC domain-containing protein [Pyronema omphalodes]
MLKPPNRERSIVMRDKENTRSRKWRNMATRIGPRPGSSDSAQGFGAEWSFNTSDSKLISRTWKGIPDCWRGAAWHSFLTESYKKRGIGRPDYELIQIYNELLERPSADDVQIDLDVPRTISSHVMFRRRYRGGQRLLFRVLHCLALYNPDIGYVQGMASIAATLLCYYEESTAFVMMVRLWELRGLERLYEPDFTGLMTCLNELENSWMKGSPIAKKLFDLGIQPTAYATRWYLTLFNYSIPFAAQLRVWDVFILLGDPDEKRQRKQQEGETDGTFDVLHATGAAILDGLKTVILKADFEEGMKNLTSFVPVKDEDTLMRVVKGEWRRKRGSRLGL